MEAGSSNEKKPGDGNQGNPADPIRRERQRIARLLHDTVCQEITGIGLLVGAMANQQRTASPALAEQLMEIAGMMQRTGVTTQEIMRGLQEEA